MNKNTLGETLGGMDGWTYDRDDLALDEGRQRNELQVQREVELKFGNAFR